MKIRLFAIIFLLLFSFYEANKFLNKNRAELTPENIKSQIELKSGDIILRKEQNAASDFFSTLDAGEYSHIGVAVNTKEGLKIFHIEVDEKTDDLKEQTVKEFAYFAKKIAIYRYKEPIDEIKLLNIIKEYKKDKIKFDYAFELNNKEFYCTELINDIYFKLFSENLYTYLYKFASKEAISINSIIKNPNLEKRYELEL